MTSIHPSMCHGCHRKWPPYNSQPKHLYPRSKKERNKQTSKQKKTYISVTVLSQTCWTFWTLKGIFFGPEMTSIHPPRATAAIENELLSIASQVQVWGANWNVNDRSIFVLTLTLQSTRTLSSLQGLLPGFLAVWLLYGLLSCFQTACLMLAWCPCPQWFQMQNISSKIMYQKLWLSKKKS